jgi:hypothetical protein
MEQSLRIDRCGGALAPISSRRIRYAESALGSVK